MYRIKFVAKGGYWAIQFLVMELYWSTLKIQAQDSEKLSIAKFNDYDEAEGYVAEKGIDKAYLRKGAAREWSSRSNPTWTYSGYQPVPKELVPQV